MNQDEINAAIKRALEVGKAVAKEQSYNEGYKDGWQEGFDYCLRLFGGKNAIHLNDEDVDDKGTSMEIFLRNLEF